MNTGDGRAFVTGFGSLVEGRGGIAWSLAGGGGIVLSEAEVTVAPGDASPPGAEQSNLWSYRSEWDADPLEGAGVFRHLAIETQEGASILLSATGDPGIEGHGLERTEAMLVSADGSTPYEEALLSTQYDGDGNPTRIGLELWPEEADQGSAAATRASGSLIAGAHSGGVWAGFFRCNTDGTEGLGTYLLWHA